MQISDSEKLLMDILWEHSSRTQPIPAKDIINLLADDLKWHDKTVKTLLNRLLKKNAINFKKQGREYLYYPVLDKECYLKDASDNFLQRVFNGSVSSLVASFAKHEKLSEQDLVELKKLIKDIDK